VLHTLSLPLAVLGLLVVPAASQAAPDIGKKACAQEAKRLCPAEMRSLSRKRVEACMITRINETSEICHATMLRLKAEHEAIVRR
jgi:hypothetical protein